MRRTEKKRSTSEPEQLGPLGIVQREGKRSASQPEQPEAPGRSEGQKGMQSTSQPRQPEAP